MTRQLMAYFEDVQPFIEENDEVFPAYRLKILGIIQDSGKLIRLKVELAATLDVGEPFVKACYYLEALVLDCCETVEGHNSS